MSESKNNALLTADDLSRMEKYGDYYQPCVCRDCVCSDCGTRFKKSTKWKLCSTSKIYKGRVYLIRKCRGCVNNESILVARCE